MKNESRIIDYFLKSAVNFHISTAFRNTILYSSVECGIG